MAQIEYSNGVYRSTKQQIRKEIIQAYESSPKLRKEIARVFQMANRRIQNIEKAGIFSPAVEALHKEDISGYTKFSMRNDWITLRREYQKAVAFLRQPTSTASGARQYKRHLMDSKNLTEEEYDLQVSYLKHEYLTMKQEQFVEYALLRYKDITTDLEQAISDDDSQMNTDATTIGKAIDEDMEKAVKEGQEAFDSEEERIRKMLEDFGSYKS